jgi:hypothetical protein
MRVQRCVEGFVCSNAQRDKCCVQGRVEELERLLSEERRKVEASLKEQKTKEADLLSQVSAGYNIDVVFSYQHLWFAITDPKSEVHSV